MRILLTNDDGIYSEGLRILAARLGERFFAGRSDHQGESDEASGIWVIAPDRERSATGHAITVHYPLRIKKYPNYAANIAEALSIDGTPSDCVKIGIEAILPKPPDIVVSGINLGPNLGTDVIYSGTVAGAVEAVLSGIPAIAVSTMSDPADLPYIADWIANLVEKVVHDGLPQETLLNVNFPNRSHDALRGVRITRPGIRRYRDVFDKRVDPRGREYYWMAGEPFELDPGEDTDSAAVESGFVSISPVRFQLTDPELIKVMETWNLIL